MRFRACTMLALGWLALGCDDKALSAANKPAPGLKREQAAQVLAKVGDKTITVGDFAAAIERMGDIDRLRYQAPDKRRELLAEMIDVELLGQEARRRGLDKDPAVVEGVREILRDAELAQARKGIGAPAQIPAADVQAYYDAHKADFDQPERRRVSAIVLGDPHVAEEVLQKARKLDQSQAWGELYFEHSLDAPKERDPRAPPDLAGDLGIVGPPGDFRARNARVPDAVQRAAFELDKVGQIYDKAVAVDDKYYLVRLTGLSRGHTASVAEADRAIRVAILQSMVRERERKLEAELRQRFPVTVDDAALAEVKLPAEPKSKP